MPDETKRLDPSQHECPTCDPLRAQVRQLREERDAALLAVAKERERADAVVLSQERSKPLRHRAIDWLNDGMKKALPLPHAGVRAAALWLRRLRREEP